MAKRTKKTTFWAKVESTYGTDPTPDGTNNAFRVHEGELDPEIDALERPEMGITQSRLPEVGGKQRVMCNVKTPLIGSGAAGTAPKGLSAMLKAAGLQETIVASTSVTYKPRDSGHESAAIYANFDGVRHDVLGFVSEFKWEFAAGELPFVNFEGKGLWEDPTDQTFPTTHSPSDVKPKACKNLTATIDSYAAVIRSFKGGLNNVISERPDFNAATGIAGFDIVDRNPDCEWEIEAVPLATKDYWAKLTADAIVPWSVALNNGAGNIITMSGYMRIRNIKWGDGDGTRIHTIQGQLCRDSSHTAGSELSIALT